MGIEVVVIVIVIVVIGFVAYRQLSPNPSESSSETKKDDDVKKGKEADNKPIQPSQPPAGNTTSQPPPAPPQIEAKEEDLSTGGMIDFSDVDEDDEFAEIIEEPEPIVPAIDDTQTMKAVTPADTQEMKEIIDQVPAEMLPDEIIDFMDKIQQEKAELDLEDIDMVNFGDVEEEEEIRLDVTYPPPKPSVPTTSTAPQATTAHFSAFYPQEAQVENRYEVVIYAHAESMLEKITQDAEKFKIELGGAVPQPRVAKQPKSLAHGSKITIMLESEEIEFEPDTLTKTWHGDWTRYNFEFRPKAEFVDETAFVRASIMVLGFEIAKIKFAIEIIDAQPQVMAMRMEGDAPSNPFAKAKLESATTTGYEKIFISYSRKDKLVAEAFKVMQEAAGNDVFFDVDDIRTGEDWQAAIARAIDSADYFQLFWSEHSAGSEWCSYEWDYAINYRCEDDKCREFIRPVWWSAPMPPPPELLGHLNFKKLNLEALMKLYEA